MSERLRAADDFSTIRSRMNELYCERTVQIQGAPERAIPSPEDAAAVISKRGQALLGGAGVDGFCACGGPVKDCNCG